VLFDFSEELLDQATVLVTGKHTQANLRRAVSAAYYSLFHLLIRDTVSHWSNPSHYPRLVRTFEHQRMKNASANMLKLLAADTRAIDPVQGPIREKLGLVAQAVVDLQQARHMADYDIEAPLDSSDALLRVEQAIGAFYTWKEIKDADIAQDYLYSLLFKDRTF
jgi:hypothetical protein